MTFSIPSSAASAMPFSAHCGAASSKRPAMAARNAALPYIETRSDPGFRSRMEIASRSARGTVPTRLDPRAMSRGTASPAPRRVDRSTRKLAIASSIAERSPRPRHADRARRASFDERGRPGPLVVLGELERTTISTPPRPAMSSRVARSPASRRNAHQLVLDVRPLVTCGLDELERLARSGERGSRRGPRAAPPPSPRSSRRPPRASRRAARAGSAGTRRRERARARRRTPPRRRSRDTRTGPDELAAHELVQARRTSSRSRLPTAADGAGPEDPAHDRGVVQECLSVRAERVEPCRHQAPAPSPGTVRSSTSAALGEHARELLGVERVSTGALEEHGLRLRGKQRTARGGPAGAGRPPPSRAGESEIVVALRLPPPQPTAARRARGVRCRGGTAGTGRPVEQMLEELEQRSVGPVQVLDDEDARPSRGHRLEEAPPGSERLLPTDRRSVALRTDERREPRAEPGALRLVRERDRRPPRSSLTRRPAGRPTRGSPPPL